MPSHNTLPEHEAQHLKELYESEDREALKTYIVSLRAQKWPLRAIGDPLGLSRSTIQYWERSAESEGGSTLLSPRAIETSGVRTARWRTQISEGDKIRFSELSAQAQKVRSQTSKHSDLRKAATELDLLIEKYLDKMVPITEIAKAMGVTHRAVKARMERRDG